MTDLHTPQILAVLAQLAVVLVGFSALVGALRRVSAPRHQQLHQIRVSTIVLLPVIALVFSLAPYALANLGFTEPFLWRLLSAAFAVVCAGALVRVLSLNWRAAGGLKMDEPVHYWFSVAASVALVGVQLANAAGRFARNEFGVYLFGVIWLVIESTHIFWVSFRASLEIEP